MRSPISRTASAIALVVLHLTTLIGGFLAPNSPTKQNRDLPWAPPTTLHFLDSDGRFYFRPFIYRLVPSPTDPYTYQEQRSQRYHLQFFVKGDPYRLAGLVPTNRHFLGVEAPARLYYLGTDGVGRDVFARTLVGGRVSLFAGLLAAALALSLGLLLGATAGYLGGHIDALFMVAVELFLALPWLYLLLAVRAFLPLMLPPLTSFLILVAVIGLIGWARPARLFRNFFLSARERTFVAAARGYGTGHSRLLINHLLPQALTLLRTQAAILIPTYILAEVALSFLGLGVAQPLASWGTLLAQLQNYHVIGRHLTMLTPAILLISTALLYFSLSSRSTPSLQDRPNA